MPVMIEQRFPLGRFHATRWNQNPFEDRYGEWPPSPWRLLRALAGRWFQYQRESGDDNVEIRNALLRALASELPVFRLPLFTWGGQELRLYHPTALELQYKYKKNPKTKKNELEYSFRQTSTTLVRDVYRAVAQGDSIIWMWLQLTLSQMQLDLLDRLLRRVLYFGRAESLTSFRLIPQAIESADPNCVLRAEPSSTSVPVLAHRPDHKLDIDLVLAVTDDKRLSNAPVPTGTAWYYADLPPVPHRRPAQRSIPCRPWPQVFRFALDSIVPPLVTETLPVAEAARRCLMGTYGRSAWRRLHGDEPYPREPALRPKSPVFSGKDAQGVCLKGHRHTYYLPTDEDGDGHLDHLTVYAGAGFQRDEQRALDFLRELRVGQRREDRQPLRLLLLGMGTLDEYKPRPLQASRVWVSATPYLATRFAKTRGKDRIDLGSPEARTAFLIDDLREQLRSALPDRDIKQVQIEPISDPNGAFKVAECWRPIQFKRYRAKSTDDGGRRLAGAFRLTFPTAVSGPICLGHSSHFGMGLFVPEDKV